MFFGKKTKKESVKCANCKSDITTDYSFCPYCGNILFDPQARAKDYGMLGKTDSFDDSMMRQKISESNLTITDKMISSIFNSLMKSMDQQFREMDKSGNQKAGLPRNIKINIGLAKQNPQQIHKKPQRHDFSISKISEDQLKKMSSLPKTAAKANVKRLGDKVFYELDAPGIESIKDIFVSKLESGYEIKALAKTKVYVNSLPVNLPINSFTLDKEKLSIEFSQNVEQ